MITEYGADAIGGIHSAVPNMFSEEFQAEYYKAINAVLDEFPFVIGEHAWNFADFQTVQGTMRADGNKKGVFTRDRRPKLAAH
jgi:beta-glucuronidase